MEERRDPWAVKFHSLFISLASPFIVTGRGYGNYLSTVQGRVASLSCGWCPISLTNTTWYSVSILGSMTECQLSCGSLVGGLEGFNKYPPTSNFPNFWNSVLLNRTLTPAQNFPASVRLHGLLLLSFLAWKHIPLFEVQTTWRKSR